MSIEQGHSAEAMGIETGREGTPIEDLSLIEHTGEIPDGVTLEVLQKLKIRLEDSIRHHARDMGENLTYAIPFKPLFDAVEGKGVARAIHTTSAASGLNIPIGLALALKEATELLGKYRLMLKTRAELRRRTSVGQ